MNFWLVKSEPDAFSWDQQVAHGVEPWTGVRSYQARNNLREMRKGDLAFFYHSNEGKEIVGVVEVVREAYADPTAEKGDWSCVDMKAVAPMPRPVTLAEIKADPALADMALVRFSPPFRGAGECRGVEARLCAGEMEEDAQIAPESAGPAGGAAMRALCPAAAIPPGATCAFESGDPAIPGLFAVHHYRDGILIYRNACPHLHVPLDWAPGEIPERRRHAHRLRDPRRRVPDR